MFKKIKKSLKTFIAEYKQVKWPTPSTTVNLTIFVIIISAIIMFIILALDTFFFELRSNIIFN